MPREIVKNSSDGPFDVKVGWGPGLGIQLGVENDEYRSIAWLLYAPDGSPGKDDALVSVGTAVREVLLEQAGVSIPAMGGADGLTALDANIGRAALNALDTVAVYSGLWADLDRQSINRLIRILRKGRDAVFGRDE